MRASGGRVRSEHEVVDDELAPAGEEIGERLTAVGTVEAVLMLDRFPWERSPGGRKLVAEPSELLFLEQQPPPRFDPFGARNDRVVRDHEDLRPRWFTNWSSFAAQPASVRARTSGATSPS